MEVRCFNYVNAHHFYQTYSREQRAKAFDNDASKLACRFRKTAPGDIQLEVSKARLYSLSDIHEIQVAKQVWAVVKKLLNYWG